jgi:sulfur carrier protein ThiS
MKIMFINNSGGGFADHIEIESNTTVAELCEKKIQGQPSDYLIRVNRQPVAADNVLQPGDRVSITPTKIEGANVAN